MEKGLTKEHSGMLYGIAILLMLFHHLYCMPSRINVPYFSTVDYLCGGGTEERIAWFCKICVGIYTFIAGYAIQRNSRADAFGESNVIELTISQIVKMLKRYWIVFLIMVPIGVVFFDLRDLGIKELIKNFLTLSKSYCYEWWYVGFYISAMISFPFISCGFKYANRQENVYIKIIYKCVTMFLFCLIHKMFGNALTYPLIFLIGFVMAEENVFERIYNAQKHNRVLFNVLVLFLCIIIRVIVSKSAGYDDIDVVIIAPFVYSLGSLLDKTQRIKKILTYIGKRSVYMWLTHTFFCYYYFQELTFISRNDIVVYIQLICVTLVASNLLMKAELLINRFSDKVFKIS